MKTTKYIVAFGDYDIGFDASVSCICFDPDGEKQCKAHIKSDEIDYRTTKEKTFDTLEEARDYSKSVVKNRKDDEWLAYVEIKKIETEIVEDVYSGACKGCDGSGWQSGEKEGFLCNLCEGACSCKKTGRENCIIHKFINH